MKKIFLLLYIVSQSAFANVSLPKIFGDNMVLQRDMPITIWGWANAKEKITIKLNKQIKSIVADEKGNWKVILNTEKAGGPYTLSVSGKNIILFKNILIGDVWVCSGQSNMELNVSGVTNAAEEMKLSNFPTIRHIKIPNTVASSPMNDIKGGSWEVCSPETVDHFTAVGYFFARELTKELNVPIGLINTSWGGTHVETWTSREAFEGSEEFKSMIASMPKLNLDSLGSINKAASIKRIENLQGSIQLSPQEIQKWKENNFDDTSWPSIKVPGLWEQQALGNVDGVVWYRKSFKISPSDAGKEAFISLAMIDDNDETYINGTKVGMTNKYNDPRNYLIPAGIMTEGNNTIAVRVVDTGGGGGIYGAAEDVKIKLESNTLSLAGEWKFKVESLGSNITGIGPNSYPTLLFNAMINPLIQYSIKGALWYQGEANTGRAFQYRKAFPLMISDWRKQWKQGDFPFYFVQLATFNAENGNSKSGSTWAELREAQAMTLSLPNTGMSITTDIGEPKDIHPKNKQDVGKRLAAIALNKTYNKNIVSEGPAYTAIKVDGQKIIVSFTNIGGGLVANDKYGYIKGFEIAGDDKIFNYAKAFIENGHIVVYHDRIKNPIAVRYGWADNAEDNNLYNQEGFPAAPFRSDNWKGITEDAKYFVGE